MLSYEKRKQIVINFLKIIKGISDHEYQMRVWVRGEGPECDDYTDTCCNFFAFEEGVLEKYKDFGITEEQYHILKKFRDEFEVFSSEYGGLAPFFINTPEWAKIMERAQEVLRAFDYKESTN